MLSSLAAEFSLVAVCSSRVRQPVGRAKGDPRAKIVELLLEMSDESSSAVQVGHYHRSQSLLLGYLGEVTLVHDSLASGGCDDPAPMGSGGRPRHCAISGLRAAHHAFSSRTRRARAQELLASLAPSASLF